MLANGIDCYITTNGIRLPEYDAHGQFITHRQCFIATTEGQRFSINVDVKQFPDAKYSVAAWVSGTTVANEYFFSKGQVGGSTVLEIDQASIILDDGSGEEPMIYRNMVFELPKITDADIATAMKRPISADEARIPPGSTMGTVIVQVGIELPMKHGFKEMFLEWPVLPRVGLDGNPVPQPPWIPKMRWGTEPDDGQPPQMQQQLGGGIGNNIKNIAPPVITPSETCIGPVLATFRFKFGTKDSLLAMNLIPEDGDVDTMSMEELQQEVKLLRAEKRKRTEEPMLHEGNEMAKKIKIEKE